MSAEPAAGSDRKTRIETLLKKVTSARRMLLEEIHKVVVGQEEVIESLLTALLAQGHCLLVGVPGLAKTLLVRTLAQCLDLSFKRIQFTPDLMPADITGTDILEEDPQTRQRTYKFVKGPVFTSVLLADEINRTPPKTQAALLEAMQEYRVTAAGSSYNLPRPFFVLATQNPIEQEGTYPLPEAQLDRFMFEVRVDYPDRLEEMEILRATTSGTPEPPLVVLVGKQIQELQSIVRSVPVSEYILLYAADLARASRPGAGQAPEFIEKYITWGAGPRAGQYLVLGAKARAVLHGRVNVSAADVRAVAPLVLRHRIFVNFNADSDGIDADEIVAMLLEQVPEPSEHDLRSLGGEAR